MGKLEDRFDIGFTAALAQKEKQIQQNYRPIIGVHKWFARRPGTVFRNLLLAEFNGEEPLESAYWRTHNFKGVIADPFMGGGTPIYEANRLGFSVIGTDINPMAYWIVRQSLTHLDLHDFAKASESVIGDVEDEVGDYYQTECTECGRPAKAKYFLWVKTQLCPHCGQQHDLFPGYLLAEAVRHPRHVVACSQCGRLNEYDYQPTAEEPGTCTECGHPVQVEGPAADGKINCRQCGRSFPYPPTQADTPPTHRMWAIEYHCDNCKSEHKGRFFKKPDDADLDRFVRSVRQYAKAKQNLLIPQEAIPKGDETNRLHRWGYSLYRQMFNERQLLGLGLLLRRIMKEPDTNIRNALLTVFSDFLRYQNMLCRYDTYALKCQDIFSVHGFPVGLIQCENNLLGIPKVGSGAFRHFIEKYRRAKEYCANPFETRVEDGKKKTIPITAEKIEAVLVQGFPRSGKRQAWIESASATAIDLRPNSLEGVFTDPPYFDNVQYAELIDFCFVWLRLPLSHEFACFMPHSTRSTQELTGNETMGRGLDDFAEGLSRVFCHYSKALKKSAPFVFTYHHNNPAAYAPLVVAILDAGLCCTATLPVPAEMGVSLHIAKSQSSVLDSVFVCRDTADPRDIDPIEESLRHDIGALRRAGLGVTEGDVRCLLAGHIARITINQLFLEWNGMLPLSEKMALATNLLQAQAQEIPLSVLLSDLNVEKRSKPMRGVAHAASV